MIKLIATDMDGTFLNSKKQFDKEFIDIFQQLKQKDITFVVASGNQFYRLYQKFIPMSSDMYFVAENGSYIAKGEKELYCNIIDQKHVSKVKDIIKKIPRIFMIMCGKKGAYILTHNKDYDLEIRKYYCTFTYVDSFDEVNDDIMKIAIFDKERHIQDVLDDVRNKLPEDVKVVTSGNEWMDIMNKEVNKGKGMEYLCKILDILPEECAAFGDQMNDYEMLDYVKYGYAMSNAVDDIKSIAYEVIGSYDDQAVLSKIKEIIK